MKKVELHTHTNYSKDSVTPFNEIIESCLKNNIDVLAVTDHNQIEGALRLKAMAPFEVIVGEEILTKDGEIIGLFLKELIPGNLSMEETIKLIRNQGGLVYLPHPFDKTTRRTSIDRRLLLTLLPLIDIVEVYNGRSVLPWDNRKAKKLAKTNGKIMSIGSDAHTKFEYGRNYLEMSDFKDQKEFLRVLKEAKIKSSWVMYFVFFLTKWARFIKRHRKAIKEIRGKVNCEICGSNRFEVIYKKKGIAKNEYFITDDSYGVHSQIVTCLDCGLIFAYPIEDVKKIEDRYTRFEDPEYEKERLSRNKNQEKILERINDILPSKGKLLEIGCATGGFLEIAKKDGWDITGVEPSKWAVDIAKSHNLNVILGTTDDLRKENCFDVIVCFDVIEHLSSPRKLINQVNKLLKPKGLFCLVTPDKSSITARILGEKWWHIRPDHIFYFSGYSLKNLLRSENFNVIKKGRYSWTFSFDYWHSRLKNNFLPFYNLGNFIKKIPVMNYFTKRTYSINFHDSLELYCVKNNV